MSKRLFNLNIEWPELADDSLPVRDPAGVGAQVLTALRGAGVVAYEVRHGVWESWDRSEKQGLGVFTWLQGIRVDDIWAAVTSAREVLVALGAPPETRFCVWGRGTHVVRTYPLKPAQGYDEWADLDQVERLSALPADWVRE
jgi:hypothetical protein